MLSEISQMCQSCAFCMVLLALFLVVTHLNRQAVIRKKEREFKWLMERYKKGKF